MFTITLRSFHCAVLTLLLHATVFAQQGGNYQLQPTVVAGGGGTSNGGSQRIEGTIGQSLAGLLSGGNYQLASGFWFALAPAGPGCAPVTLHPTQAALPNATIGMPYSQVFTASGALSFSASALPPGLQFSTDGVLSGTPTATGNFNIGVTVTDASGCPGRRDYTLAVGCAAVSATISGSANICPGGSAVIAVNVSGGTAPYTVTLTNGGGTRTSSTLPMLFTVNPTATTTYAVASATDAYGCPVNVSGSATITVSVGALPDTNLTGIPPSVSAANVSFSFTGSGGCSTVTFECKLDNGNWTACTSPQSYSSLANGAHQFQVRARDAMGNVDATPATYPWTVFTASCGTVVNPATLPAATRGTPFVQTLSASPTGSYTFSLLTGTLPPGVNLVNTLGIYSLRGTPTTTGTYTFTIRASKNNSACAGARTYTLPVR